MPWTHLPETGNTIQRRGRIHLVTESIMASWPRRTASVMPKQMQPRTKKRRKSYSSLFKADTIFTIPEEKIDTIGNPRIIRGKSESKAPHSGGMIMITICNKYFKRKNGRWGIIGHGTTPKKGGDIYEKILCLMIFL
jgi:hypothetical protein